MSDNLPFLASSGGRSTDELIALEDEYRIDSIVLAFEGQLMLKESPTPEETVVLAIEGVEREVNNGGFSQFFVNSSREFVPVVVAALQAIGCPKTASLMRSAMDILGIDESSDSDAIEDAACDATDEQNDQLNALDNIYYAGEEEPIANKLFEFIKNNRQSITTN